MDNIFVKNIFSLIGVFIEASLAIIIASVTGWVIVSYLLSSWFLVTIACVLAAAAIIIITSIIYCMVKNVQQILIRSKYRI